MIDIPVSWGELIDKITILEIKSEKLNNASARENVIKELALLRDRLNSANTHNMNITDLTARLKNINTKLWGIEDDIRACEHHKDFGDRFIELARAVYYTNDERADLKRALNIAMNSEIIEEKGYTDYT